MTRCHICSLSDTLYMTYCIKWLNLEDNVDDWLDEKKLKYSIDIINTIESLNISYNHSDTVLLQSFEKHFPTIHSDIIDIKYQIISILSERRNEKLQEYSHLIESVSHSLYSEFVNMLQTDSIYNIEIEEDITKENLDDYMFNTDDNIDLYVVFKGLLRYKIFKQIKHKYLANVKLDIQRLNNQKQFLTRMLDCPFVSKYDINTQNLLIKYIESKLNI